MVNRPGDGAPAAGTALPHNRYMDVGAFAVALVFPVRANSPVADGAAASALLTGWHNGIIEGMANDTAEIRAWAQAQGYDVGPRGRLPQEVRDAYNRATLTPLPGDGEGFEIVDGDDVGLPPLAEPLPEPDTRWWEQDSEAAPEPGPVIPDPAPAKIGKRAKGSAKKPTAAVAADVRGQLTLWLGTGASIFQAVDPICGGVAVQVAGPAADAWTDVILQSPRAIEFFTGPAGMAMLVLRGVYATMPLLNVVWAHHIARTIKTEDEPQPERQYAA